MAYENAWATYDLLSRTIASAKKVFKIIDRYLILQGKEDGYFPENIRGDIELRNVSFKYNEDLVLKTLILKYQQEVQ